MSSSCFFFNHSMTWLYHKHLGCCCQLLMELWLLYVQDLEKNCGDFKKVRWHWSNWWLASDNLPNHLYFDRSYYKCCWCCQLWVSEYSVAHKWGILSASWEICNLPMSVSQSWNCITYRYKFLPNPKDGSIYSIGRDGNQLEVLLCCDTHTILIVCIFNL